jgi:hypothetical protein
MADDAAAVPAENEDLAALGGRELLSAKMELSTAKHDLGAKLAENVGLLRKAEGLKQELETQKADAKDIYFYLHKKLDDNYGEIDVLEKIKVELTDELEQTVERYELQLAEMRVAWEAEVEALKQSNEDQEEELFSLKDYKENKEALEAGMKMLEQDLQNEKEGRQNDVDQLERKMFHEKERIKKEFLIKIKETKQNLLSMTEDQLHTTTKRTIMENEQMTTELQYQSRETERLLRMNTKLRGDNKKLKRSVELTEEAGREYAKKTHFYQKLIKKLHEKIKDQDDGKSNNNKKKSGTGRQQNARPSADGGNESMVAGTKGRSSSSKTDARVNERIVRDLQGKVSSLEINLNQVCSELDATRRQLQRVSMGRQHQSGGDGGVGGVGGSTPGDNGAPTYQSLVDFLFVSLKDAKEEAIAQPEAQGLELVQQQTPSSGGGDGSSEFAKVGASGASHNDNGPVVLAPAAVFPGALRVQMISKILDTLSKLQREEVASVNEDSSSKLDVGGSTLAEEFSQLFAAGEGSVGANAGGGSWASGFVKPEVASIAIQTDNVDPITVLRSVDVGPRNGMRSFFTDSAGSMDSELDGGGGSVNLSESDASRFLRGPVRGWGAPSSVYGMPRVNGPKTFRKRRTGLGATGRSVMSSTQ